MRFYNKQGQSITLEELCRLFSKPDYQSLQLTKLESCTISTVWLGIDHNFFGKGPPIIFETMIFPTNPDSVEETYRYATEKEALDDHARLVEKRGGKKTYISPFTGRVT